VPSRLGSSLRAKVMCCASNGRSQPPGFSLEPTRVAAYGKETASDRGLDTILH